MWGIIKFHVNVYLNHILFSIQIIDAHNDTCKFGLMILQTQQLLLLFTPVLFQL